MTDPDNREAWLTVISDLTTALTEERADNANLRRALEARAEDTARLEWLAEQARVGPMDYIVVAYTWYPERGTPGFYLEIGDAVPCSREDTLRQAIDAAMAESGT